MHTQSFRTEEERPDTHFAVDTTFVVFFLALDLGTVLFSFDIGAMLSAATLAMFIVLPYFLYEGIEKPRFAPWVAGRTVIAVFAIAAGILFKQAIGTLLPDSFRYLPLTLLIAAAIVSCYIQFYGIMKVRLAR